MPDPSDARLLAVAPKGVLATVQRGFSGLSDLCTHLQPGDASFSLYRQFSPSTDPAKKQSRLSLAACLRATEERIARTLFLAVERSSLAVLYAIETNDLPAFPWEKMNAACDILRREISVQPLYSSEDNFRIPTVFYGGSMFVPNDPDDATIDYMLDRLTEHILIHICIEPVDTARERSAITRYAARLEDIVRTWGDEPSFKADIDYFGAGESRITRTLGNVELPRKPDPFANAISKSIQAVREALYLPSLLFHFRVVAETPEVATLLGAVLAQGAFSDGAYALELTQRGAPLFESLLAGVREGRVRLTPSLGERLKEQEPLLYADFDRLAHIATVRELEGAWRWPVGSTLSPCCTSQSSDPPSVAPEDLIILGYDYQYNHGV